MRRRDAIASVLLAVLVVCTASTARGVDRQDFEPYEGQTVTEIKLEGYRVTKEYIIQREIYTDVGEALSPGMLAGDVARLDNLGIFAEVRVDVAPNADGVALTFAFQELPALIPYIKLKFTEENGWSIGPALTAMNLSGRDIYLSGFLLVGGQTTFSLRFKHPWIMDDRVHLDINLDHLIRDNTLYEFEETNDDYQLWVGRWLGQRGRLKGALNYFAIESDVDDRTLNPSNRDDMFRLYGSVAYDSRDSWTNPHAGWHHEIEGVMTWGDAEFPQLTIDIRRYQPLGGRRHTLAMGFLTTVRSGTVGQDIPEYLQFNLGGTNTIRGYRLDELGQVYFGKNQLLATIEYQFVLLPIKAYPILKWAVSGGLEAAAFIDVGNAWSDWSNVDDQRSKGGFGVGLRALVPAVNEVRFDLGMNLDGDTVFHFGVWSKFDAQRFRIR